MPAPEENVAKVYEMALRRNEKLVGAHFAIGVEDALFLRGELPRDSGVRRGGRPRRRIDLRLRRAELPGDDPARVRQPLCQAAEGHRRFSGPAMPPRISVHAGRMVLFGESRSTIRSAHQDAGWLACGDDQVPIGRGRRRQHGRRPGRRAAGRWLARPPSSPWSRCSTARREALTTMFPGVAVSDTRAAVRRRGDRRQAARRSRRGVAAAAAAGAPHLVDRRRRLDRRPAEGVR